MLGGAIGLGFLTLADCGGGKGELQSQHFLSLLSKPIPKSAQFSQIHWPSFFLVLFFSSCFLLVVQKIIGEFFFGGEFFGGICSADVFSAELAGGFCWRTLGHDGRVGVVEF